MANSKQLMGLTESELVALGIQSGIQFQPGMKKSHMVQAIMNQQASGWAEVNASMHEGVAEDDYGVDLGNSSMLSDAAHAAQMLAGAGFTETFHNIMGGGATHHVEAINAYMRQLGTNANDVWLHMPQANPNEPSRHFGQLNAYMRDTLTGNQDIMPEIPGHYSGDIMSEYATNRGGVQETYEYLAHMYVDKSGYQDRNLYDHDVSRVAQRLATQLPSGLGEVAFNAAISEGNPNAPHVSYMATLPRIGDPNIVKGVANPRQPLNASGLPFGSFGGGINSEYSLAASLSGSPGWSDASKALHKDISGAVKSLAGVYRGDTGMNPNRYQTSEYDQIMDSATRYVDVEDARSGYTNLGEPSYSGSTIRQIVENSYDKMESGVQETFDPAAAARSFHETMAAIPATGTGFTASFDSATDFNFARARRESKLIADMDAASAGPAPQDPVTYHRNIQQGTPEWLAMRENYDITGSTVGTLLGHGSYTTMHKKVTELEGLYPSSRDVNSAFSQKMFARGHASEAAARPRVEQEFGINIQEVGAITNSDYPNMMYSPDGLIGDDALWEHKNPNITKKYANLAAGEHQDYMDQIQLGMHLSGRSRTLFSQTVGSDTRSEWIDKDPTWFDRNKQQLDSIAGRREAVRNYVSENSEQFERDMASTDDEKEQTRIRNRYRRGAQNAAKGDASGFVDYEAETSTSTSVAAADGMDRMAVSVKSGILAANEEMKQRRASSGKGSSLPDEDADFDDLGAPRGWSRSRIDDALGGGGSGGGGGGRRGGGSFYDDYGRMGGALAAGVAGGSLSSLSGGAMQALMATPWGRVAGMGIGAIQIGNEAAEGLNDFVGNALDAGMTNPNEYSSMSQGMEMLGLNSQQASRINQTTHSAYNTLQNGDPSGAARITSATRGLITITDINETQGDPVALARIMQRRGQERGWSQAQIAGASQMAGLDGMARAFDRTEYSMGEAQTVVQSGRDSQYTEGAAQLEMLQGERARVLPGYNVPQMAISHGGPVIEAGADAVRQTRYGVAAVGEGWDSLTSAVKQLESGGDMNAQSTTSTAAGSMQVLSGTARDPGFGVRPAQNNSPEELERVGRDYQNAMVNYYGGDKRKAAAAYTDGPGTVDNAVKDYGINWLQHMPAQAQKRVNDLEKMGVFDGAGRFTVGSTGGNAPANVNVNITATINNKEANATATVAGGQTVTQQVNVAAGAAQMRR
ncbi:virion structural protein [Erwinia phage Faunus]|uniref:Uncharacterized protein n=1 Tax=Erwinia phage Faunus TaxID=2182346 RepID=A0A2U8UWK5_9CAUD|nr:virion structural protein [Erwinia phage Faunus]AWN08646.1 hypothetical protein [Erwinia phage Faunus]